MVSHRTPLYDDEAAGRIPPRLLSLNQAAAILGISRRTLDRLLSARKLPSVQVSEGRRTISARDLEVYIATHREASPP